MAVAHRRGLIPDAGHLSATMPYAERPDHRESRLDHTLLEIWGRVAPYLLSKIARQQLERVVQLAEDHEYQLTTLRDEQLRQTADELRRRLISANSTPDRIAF